MKKIREIYYRWEHRIYQWKVKIRRFRRKSSRFTDPVFALAQLALGGFLFYSAILIWNEPGYYWEQVKPSQEQIEKLGLDEVILKTQKITRNVNRNAEYTLMRHNMEIVKLMLEAYPIEQNGYPPDVSSLYHDATAKDYWRPVRNPLTRDNHYRGSLANYADYENDYIKTGYEGMIIYQPMGNPPRAFKLYACDDDGKFITRMNGEVFSITNSL